MYDFGFGECVAVRNVLDSIYLPTDKRLREILSVGNMGYPNSDLSNLLISQTKSLILARIGLQYNRIVITAGASNAICSLLRVLKSKFLFDSVHYRSPYFGYYPKFADKSGTLVLKEPGSMAMNWIDLIDSPSNPTGRLFAGSVSSAPFVIWDATYNNAIYSNAPFLFPSHDVMVGSYGKLFGINGVRVGWIALNDHTLADLLVKEVYEETLGVSVPSYKLLSDVLDTVDLTTFMAIAKANVDNNRESIAKLEYLADYGEVPDNGMFYWAKMSSKAQSLLTATGVTWIKGSSCGADDSYVRLNLAQNTNITKKMVSAVLKADRRKV